jgi:hypothetical protein
MSGNKIEKLQDRMQVDSAAAVRQMQFRTIFPQQPPASSRGFFCMFSPARRLKEISIIQSWLPVTRDFEFPMHQAPLGAAGGAMVQLILPSLQNTCSETCWGDRFWARLMPEHRQHSGFQ